MTSYKGTAVIFCTLSTAEPSKGPKKANNRLNATTRCKAASLCFFNSLRLLPNGLPYTSRYMQLVCTSIAHVLGRIRVRRIIYTPRV